MTLILWVCPLLLWLISQYVFQLQEWHSANFHIFHGQEYCRLAEIRHVFALGSSTQVWTLSVHFVLCWIIVLFVLPNFWTANEQWGWLGDSRVTSLGSQLTSQLVSDWMSIILDWHSIDVGLYLNWMSSPMMNVKWRRIGLQVVWDRQLRGVPLAVLW